MYRNMNPYDSLLQKAIKGSIDSIKESILSYRAMGPGDLGYGYSNNDVEYIFITGANDIEKGIPRFTLPIVDLEGRKPLVITDMRLFAKSKLDRIEDKLEDMVLTRTTFNIPIEQALLLGTSIEGTIIMKTYWYKAFSFFVTNMLTAELGLDPYDRASMHVSVLTYMVDIIERDRDINSRDIIVSNNIELVGNRLELEDIKEINKNFNREPNSLDILIENINKSSEDRRLKTMTIDILLGSVAKLVIRRDVVAINNSFEFPELFLPLLFTYVDNSFLKKTKLAEGFKYINRKVDIKEMGKELKILKR